MAKLIPIFTLLLASNVAVASMYERCLLKGEVLQEKIVEQGNRATYSIKLTVEKVKTLMMSWPCERHLGSQMVIESNESQSWFADSTWPSVGQQVTIEYSYGEGECGSGKELKMCSATHFQIHDFEGF